MILARVAVFIGRYAGEFLLVIGAHAGDSADRDDMAFYRGKLGDVLEGEWKEVTTVIESLETA
jgi:hypothetical protein